MLTSKRRAELRAEANGIETLIHIGKGGISDALITQAKETLIARELVKCRVLEAAMLTAREAADELSIKTGADVVATVGATFVIYKHNPKLHQKIQAKKVENPVKAGARQRKRQQQERRRAKDEYFASKRKEKN